MNTVSERIINFNAGRNPVTLARKYSIMRQSVFSFYRGTCHLFYEDLSQHTPFTDPTLVWICGDLHLENFGCFKGDNRVEYFDLNDFDEAALAPATWEISRFITSILVASESLGIEVGTAVRLCESSLHTYSSVLRGGKAVIIEPESAEGILQQYLTQVDKRKVKDLIKKRTVEKNGKLKLLTDNQHAIALTKTKKEELREWLLGPEPRQDWPACYEIVDIAFRIAGTGSLGVERFAILVRDRDNDEKFALLDLKQATSSSLAPYIKNFAQPNWTTEADRVISIQQRVQHVNPHLLSEVDSADKTYILKELQPTSDKMDFTLCKGKFGHFEAILGTMSELVASGQLRSGGRQWSSITDQLIAFGSETKWQEEVLAYAKDYSTRVASDWKQYCEDYDAGAFPTKGECEYLKS